MLLRVFVVLAAFGANVALAIGSDVFSINDAIQQAVRTNPAVSEAGANRRATEAELRQAQGTVLPQGRLEANARQTSRLR